MKRPAARPNSSVEIAVLSPTLGITVGRAVAFAVARLLRFTNAKLGVAVMYHRVGVPAGDYSREIVPNLATDLFEAQVRHLRSNYRLVRASELPDAVARRRRGERIPAAITFDDDLPSHVKVAAPALEKLGLPATFFLTGASLEAPHAFWWEHLQEAVDRGLVEHRPEDIHDVATAMRLAEPAERRRMEQELAAVAALPAEGSGLRSTDVRALAERGFEIGFHTRRHHYLPKLDDAALEEAMHEGLAELAAAADAEIDSIAYPHGGADARVVAAAGAAGYRTGYATGGEAIGPDSDPLLLPRIEAPFTSTGELAITVARKLAGRAYRARAASR